MKVAHTCRLSKWRRYALAPLLALAFAPFPAAAYDWLQFGGDAQHSGNNALERSIARSNVSTLAQRFRVTLPGTADGAPVYLQGVTTAIGVQDLLFLTTTAGHIVAIDAHTGAQVWSHQNGPGTGVNTCKINKGSNTCYTTSSPAIDPNRQYVYSYGLDGYVHKYQAGTGTEITTGGWPELTTLKGYDEKGSSALSFATSGGTTYLYMVHGGYPGDGGDYQGHVTAINLGNGVQTVFNAACSDKTVHLQHHISGDPVSATTCASVQNAMWSRPGVIYDAGTDRIFTGTGNAFSTNAGRFNGIHDWSESVLALHPDASGGSGVNAGKPLDSYTPAEWNSLDNADTDVGSTAPAILPVPANSTVQKLGLQSGKDSKLRLLDLQNLNGSGGPGNTAGEIGAVINVPQGGAVTTQPAVWVNSADASTRLFVMNGSGASSLKLNIDGSGNPSLATQWQGGSGSSSPVIANGMVLFINGGSVRALDAISGALLWNIANPGGMHWQSLIAANGNVYAADNSGNLTAFAPLGSGIPKGKSDFNGDGNADIAWDNGTGSLWLYNMLGIVPQITGQLPGAAPGWVVAGIGDFNGDGHADLLWKNTASPAQFWIYLLNGTTLIGGGSVTVATGFLPTRIGDFNGDGKDDIVWENASGARWIYFMNGANVTSAQAAPAAAAGWVIAGVGDFNGDGKSDLLWLNTANPQQYWIYLMNGTSVIGGGPVNVAQGYRATQIADFDGDGKADILWEDGTASRWIFFMNGAGVTSASPAPGAVAGWEVVGTGDFNGDGRADLLWQNSAAPTQFWVYLLNGTSVFGSGGIGAAPGYLPIGQ